MSAGEVKKQSSVWDQARPFLFGCIAGCTATSVIQPVDTIQVRIQLVSKKLADQMKAQGQTGKQSVGFFEIASDIMQKDGIKGFYSGLDSAIMRQVFYGTARLGLFRTFTDIIKQQNKRNLTLFEQVYTSLTAGLLAAIIGNPADLILVRMQADTLLPQAERRGYSSFFSALVRIPKEEGFTSLWRGCNPTIARAMSANLGMLATFDECQQRLDQYRGQKDLLSTKLIASAIAGVATAFASLPFDNIQTKLQSMNANAQGVYPYKGVMDCLLKSVASEGALGLWVGIGTYMFRVGPHVGVTLLTLEALNGWYDRNYKH